MSQVLLSGTVRTSATTSFINSTQTTPFSATITISALDQRLFILSANVSEFVVSYADMPAPSVLVLTSDQIIRVNFGGVGGVSYISLASAGIQFKDVFMIGGSGMSGFTNLHFSNSGTSAANLGILIAQ